MCLEVDLCDIGLMMFGQLPYCIKGFDHAKGIPSGKAFWFVCAICCHFIVTVNVIVAKLASIFNV